MAHYSENLMADSSVSLRRWLLPAIVLSFLIHCGMLYLFGQKTLDRFVPADTPRLVPRAFNISRLQVDQKLLESDSKPTKEPGKHPFPVREQRSPTFNGDYQLLMTP